MMKTLLYAYASFLAVLLVAGTAAAQEHAEGETTAKADINPGLKAIAAAVAVGLTGLAAAIGEQAIGAAAVGAMAEDPKLFGRGLLMTVIPETIVIFGLVVALIILFV